MTRMKSLRAVLAYMTLALLIVGVSGASEIGLPASGLREAYRAPWRDGAKLIRVQHLGPHLALVTIAPARVIGSIKVTETVGGAFLAERTVLLMGDEVALAEADFEAPTRAWWDKVLGIERGMPREPLPATPMPTAATPGPGGTR